MLGNGRSNFIDQVAKAGPAGQATVLQPIERIYKNIINITQTCLYNMQRFLKGCITENFKKKKEIYFLMFAQNIDWWYMYSLEPLSEYPQSMFWSKNKKKMYTPVNHTFTL